MKHSVRKEDVTYIVKPEEKKVIAFIECTEDMFLNFLEENFPDTHIWSSSNFHSKLKMPNKFVGISTCGPDDVWNENTGKLIAFDRMKDCLNKSFFKRANTFVAEMEKRLDSFCDTVNLYGERLEHNTLRRKALIESILDEAEDECKND